MDWGTIFSNKKKFEKFKKTLSKCSTLAEAAKVLSNEHGERVTKDGLYAAYSRSYGTREGPKNLADLLKKQDFVASSLEKKAEKDAVSKLREESQSMAEALIEARKQVDVLSKLHKNKEIVKIKPSGVKGSKEATAVIMASDWHVEETVDAATVNYRNEFNLEIADARVNAFFTNSAKLVNYHRRAGMKIENIVLWLGGDLLTGYIHEELEESNGLSPTETVLWLIKRITGGIQHLLTTDCKITVVCNEGNHGRTTKKKRISTSSRNSFEWLMYHLLAQRFDGQDKVNFIIADGPHVYLDIYKWKFRFTHGDTFNYGGGVGGLSVPLLKGVQRLESFKHAHYTCVGHFHQQRDFESIIVNGSLIGYSPFAISIGAAFEEPKQALFLVTPEKGKDMVTSIWLGDNHGEA